MITYRDEKNSTSKINQLPKFLRSGLVYKYKCSCGNAICYDKSKSHSKVQICQHFDIPYLTGEKLKVNNKLTAIQK